mmetsp:Transcript_51529/g.147783  ORF Transcript_51529/g.147783 Transcript_51529/m.147783 type:complete len:289 (+) Transcript_51529:186-1052(+)
MAAKRPRLTRNAPSGEVAAATTGRRNHACPRLFICVSSSIHGAMPPQSSGNSVTTQPYAASILWPCPTSHFARSEQVKQPPSLSLHAITPNMDVIFATSQFFSGVFLVDASSSWCSLWWTVSCSASCSASLFSRCLPCFPSSPLASSNPSRMGGANVATGFSLIEVDVEPTFVVDVVAFAFDGLVLFGAFVVGGGVVVVGGTVVVVGGDTVVVVGTARLTDTQSSRGKLCNPGFGGDLPTGRHLMFKLSIHRQPSAASSGWICTDLISQSLSGDCIKSCGNLPKSQAS